MTKEGELKAVFADDLLITSHTGEALMGQIYDETCVKKLGLNPAENREQCTGAPFDGAYFLINSPDHLAKRIVEKAIKRSSNRTVRDSELSEVASLYLMGSRASTRARGQRHPH